MPNPRDFRRIALGMKDAAEGAHMGHPDFRVYGRIFATLHLRHLRRGCQPDHEGRREARRGGRGDSMLQAVRLALQRARPGILIIATTYALSLGSGMLAAHSGNRKDGRRTFFAEDTIQKKPPAQALVPRQLEPLAFLAGECDRNGPAGKLAPGDILKGQFEIAPPGKPDAFSPYLAWESRQAGSSGL